MNNRIFAIAIAATIAVAFGSPVLANEKKNTVSESVYTGTNSRQQFSHLSDTGIKGNVKNDVPGKKKNRKSKTADFSWYKPEAPADVNPYDHIALSFAWYEAPKPRDENPYELAK